MSSDEIGGIARAIFAALGGVLVAKGVADQGTVVAGSGALVVLIQAAWSVWAKKKAKAAAAK